MNITFKTFDKLPEKAMYIRTIVFVDEQGFVDEFDESDNESIHIVMCIDEKAVGTARIVYLNEHNSYAVGRFAILKEYRNQGLGRQLMKYVEDEVVKRFGHIKIGVSSQERASKFYEKVGYKRTDETYLDQYCPHVWMIKELQILLDCCFKTTQE